MKSIELLEPTDLYNMLQFATVYPCLSDTNFLLLVDARKKHEYNESHVITAKKAPKDDNDEFAIPYDAELECKQNVIIYDSNTSDLSEDSPAMQCGRAMWDMGSRNTVRILKGGYEQFSAQYPFLRTQKILYMPREFDELQTFPAELIPGFLYLGNWSQGNSPSVQKDLKIMAHVNCCLEAETFFPEPCDSLLHIQSVDENETDLLSSFKRACKFIDGFKSQNKAVLIFSNLGTSRSATIALAYLMFTNNWPLKKAYDHAISCSPTIRPIREFVTQLYSWEQDILGRATTDIKDPNF